MQTPLANGLATPAAIRFAPKPRPSPGTPLETTWVQGELESPLGSLRLVASPQGLAGLWFVRDQRHAPSLARVQAWAHVPPHPLLLEAAQQLKAYFLGRLRTFRLPLDLAQGSAFQQAVWGALRDIPAGQTCSYRDLAARIGRPMAVRAVGAAVGRNPLSIVLPCHRVVAANGALTGYAGGLGRKSALLLLEDTDRSNDATTSP